MDLFLFTTMCDPSRGIALSSFLILNPKFFSSDRRLLRLPLKFTVVPSLFITGKTFPLYLFLVKVIKDKVQATAVTYKMVSL